MGKNRVIFLTQRLTMSRSSASAVSRCQQESCIDGLFQPAVWCAGIAPQVLQCHANWQSEQEETPCNSRKPNAAGALPHGWKLTQPVVAGEVVGWTDVAGDEANSAVRVRREMEQMCAAQPDRVVT